MSCDSFGFLICNRRPLTRRQMTRSDISIETFSKAVETIYDCALNPRGWRETLRLIGELTHSPHVAIGTMDYDQKQLLNAVEYGYDQGAWNSYLEKYSVNPMLRRCHRAPIGAIYTTPMPGVDWSDLYKSEFYNEWCIPHRSGELVGLNGLRRGRRVTALVAHRTRPQGAYGRRELRLMASLAPHICRTFAISDVVGLHSITAQALEATLNGLAAGIYLTDRSGRIVFLNRAAEDQIKSGKALRILNRRLTPVSNSARAAVDAAIAGAITNETAPPVGGTTLALPDGDSAGLLATILPLDRGQRHTVSDPLGAAAAIFVQDPTVEPTYPGEAFAKLYGLTGAEVRVLLVMAPGLGVKEAAAMLGIGEVTARTHLQHVYAKTGTSKQTELLNLLKNSTPPVKIV
jgi:DNA-binding CsgD family transcriptional regulator